MSPPSLAALCVAKEDEMTEIRHTSGLESAFWALRIGLGGAAFLAGLDKYFNLLADWPRYMAPFALSMLPISAAAFMHVIGVVEMLVGLAVLTAWTRLGAYVAMIWLLAIAGNLVLAGFYDVAVRDVIMAIGGYTLGRLAEARLAQAVARPVAAVSDDLRVSRRRATA